jgi:hypothetical protein
MKTKRKLLIHHIIDLLKAMTNYLAYRFTGHAVEWDDNAKERAKQTMILKDALAERDNEQDYPYNTEFGSGLTREEMERIDDKNREEIDEEELLGI